MLVLSRNKDQSIICTITPEKVQAIASRGESVTVTITTIRVGPLSVRLGLDAPPEMNIRRAELADAPRPPRLTTEPKARPST